MDLDFGQKLETLFAVFASLSSPVSKYQMIWFWILHAFTWSTQSKCTVWGGPLLREMLEQHYPNPPLLV
jgi:hypothetical protein